MRRAFAEGVELLRRFDLAPPERQLLREARLHGVTRIADAPPPIARGLSAALHALADRARPVGALRRLDTGSPEAAFLRAPASLAPLLVGAPAAVLIGVTLGDAFESLLAEREGHALDAFLLHAAANALVEHLADQLDALVASRARRSGLAARRRFSPGYGDFPLAAQRDFARLLDFGRLGIAVTPELLLRPAKSVTALIALAAG